MAYTFQPVGARESDVLSGDLVSNALSSYDRNRRRQFQFDEELQKSLAAQEQAKQQQEEARRSRNYTWDGGAMQDPSQPQQMNAQMQQQQQQQMPVNAQMSNQDVSDYFQSQPDMSQPNLRSEISNQMNEQGQGQREKPPLPAALSYMSSKGIKPVEFNRNGKAYYQTPFGDYEIGPAAPTDFDKDLQKANVDQIKEIDKAYTAVSGVLENARHLQEMTESPGFDEAFSDSTFQFKRWADNWYTERRGDPAVADLRARFGNTARSMVLAMSKEIKGSLTNRELGFLEATKPGANDSPRDIRSKVGNVLELAEKSRNRLSLQRKFMEQGYSVIEATEMSENMIYGAKEDKKKSESASGKEESQSDISQGIASSMGGGDMPGPGNNYDPMDMSESFAAQNNEGGMGQENPGQLDENSKRQAIMQAMSQLPAGALENMLYGAGESTLGALGKLGSAASYLTKDVPQMALDSFGDFTKGAGTQALQSTHDNVRSVANAPVDFYDYLSGNTGENAMRIKPVQFANENPESSAESLGQYAGSFSAAVPVGMVTEAAVGKLMGSLGAAGGAPFANYMRRILSTGVVGGVEGALLGEGDREKSGAAGAAAGVATGTVLGGIEYYKRLGFKNVADKVARNFVSEKTARGDAINKIVKQGEASGANKHLKKISIPKELASKFPDSIHSVKMFNDNPTVDNLQKAISAVNTASYNIGSTGKNTLSDANQGALRKLSLNMRGVLDSAFTAINLPGQGDLLDKALSEYGKLGPLLDSKPLKAYLNNPASSARAEGLVEAMLKDNVSSEILKNAVPELANTKNSRIAAKLAAAAATATTAYEAAPYAFRAMTE